MAIKRVQISAQDLVTGMFVSGLDRPWSQTPFPLQGFHIKDARDIEKVKSFSVHVYIDVTRGRSPPPGTRIFSTESDGDSSEKAEAPELYDLPHRRIDPRNQAATPPKPIDIRQGVYRKTVPLRLEAARAEAIVRELKGQLTLLHKQIAKGRLTNAEGLKKSVDDMVASVLRCPDAFNWLMRLRHTDLHTYDHALRTSMLSAQFGRYAGMSKEDIALLAMGALLKDVGKIGIPKSILKSSRRSVEEEDVYRSFVDHGVEILRTIENLDPKVITVVRYHCERYDGSGFPQGVGGGQIPLHARIVGIATEYDAISSPRESLHPVAPSRAVSLIYNMRDKRFQEDLVVKFIQSIGLYPTGTIVELTTGDLGIVMEQNPDSRLSPTIAVLDRSPDADELGDGCVFIDLKDEAAARQILTASGRANIASVPKVTIARDLEPDVYDVNLLAVSDAFLNTSSTRRKASAGKPETRGLLASLKDKLFK
ncbi:MAG: HD domain-containing phosphohydrolase [Porticoccaceae bacterium]